MALSWAEILFALLPFGSFVPCEALLLPLVRFLQWNDFLFRITVVPNPQSQPATTSTNNLNGSFSVDWNVVIADAFVAALPTVSTPNEVSHWIRLK